MLPHPRRAIITTLIRAMSRHDMASTLLKNKGKGKGGKQHNAPQSLASGGKRGRESYEEDQRNREVRHKAWNSNGMSVANTWAKSIVPRTYIRTRSVEEVMTLQHTFISADRNFQNRMSHIVHEKCNGMKPLTMLSCFYTRILACQLGSMCPLTFIT